jgi:hypothetical protein
VWSFAAILLAIVSGIAIAEYGYTYSWTPLQRLDASAYLRSAINTTLGFVAAGRYHLLHVVDAKGARLPLDVEVQLVAESDDSLTISPIARAAGAKQLVWLDRSYRHAGLYALLREVIYDNQSPLDLAKPVLWCAAGVLAMGLILAVPKDLKRTRERREGRRLKGPELVTPARFNRRLRADGLGIAQTWSLASRLVGRPPIVRLPRSLESSHILIMGDTGSGKSLIIRQLLAQIAARGETAIVYDPALEFTPEFYDERRGDVILNPLDARCPFWSPSDEVEHDAEAATIAASLFPGRDYETRETDFFTRAPRRIFAHLLTLRPSPEELASWMCHEEELDRRLAGTPYATMIDRQAPQQRTGVLSSLNMVADALLLLPAERDTSIRWSAASWAAKRRGWIFLTSTPATRERLKPLTSLWLDTLVLRLMSSGPGGRPTWFVLDELASLQRLPQLHTAVTENRKSNNPLVLGFQGRSQLEARYGRDAEAMLAQPATKIFLRTGEAHAAKWIADTIGNIEIERLVESRSLGGSRQQSYSLARQVEPLVMDSEITGLPNLRGFLKVGNLVVRLAMPYFEPGEHAPGFVPRPNAARVAGESAPPPPDTSANGPGHQIAPPGPFFK